MGNFVFFFPIYHLILCNHFTITFFFVRKAHRLQFFFTWIRLYARAILSGYWNSPLISIIRSLSRVICMWLAKSLEPLQSWEAKKRAFGPRKQVCFCFQGVISVRSDLYEKAVSATSNGSISRTVSSETPWGWTGRLMACISLLCDSLLCRSMINSPPTMHRRTSENEKKLMALHLLTDLANISSCSLGCTISLYSSYDFYCFNLQVELVLCIFDVIYQSGKLISCVTIAGGGWWCMIVGRLFESSVSTGSEASQSGGLGKKK